MAATNNNALAYLLTDAVSNFGTAYAATQETLRSNAANIAAIQGQLQMLCQVVGTSQLPQQQPRHPQNGCDRGQQCGGNNNSGNSGGNGGSCDYNNGGGGGGYNNVGGGYSSSGNSGNYGNSSGKGEIRPQAAPCQ
jgi:hypothetical protein